MAEVSLSLKMHWRNLVTTVYEHLLFTQITQIKKIKNATVQDNSTKVLKHST